ncbi:hypothetical protein LTS12_019403 [Elasticomyces elasticus]|nr:hypothetical protein LTS12_019403 [Elasticomyces elasticus]
MAGILLKRQGHHVHILEQAISSEREGQAAGIGLSGAAKAFFDEHDRLAHIPMSVEIRSLAFLDPKTMKVARQFPYKGGLTSWEFCYARLRANFDGMKSAYCPEPPDLTADTGTGVFESGKRVIDVASRAEKLVVTAEGVESGITYTYTADIVVVADGANSQMRKQMQPFVRRETPGYVLWRGVVPTSSLSQECVDLIGDKTVSYPMRYSYTIIYNIPGPTGSVKDGERYINFAWYYWPPSKQKTQEILTDTDGHVHRTTLPKGKMRPEIWAAQVEIAKRSMPPLIAEIPAKIEHPFVSLISSISAKQARFFDDRLFFIGDALVQVRTYFIQDISESCLRLACLENICQPNAGSGLTKAAREAMLLPRVLDGSLSAADWEQQVLTLAEGERLFSRSFGSYNLRTWWWGYAVDRLKYVMYMARQRLRARWAALWKWNTASTKTKAS